MEDEYGEYTVRIENLPTGYKGFCYHDDDGNCYLILNARHTRETNAGSYLHELNHIERGDMYNEKYHEYK